VVTTGTQIFAGAKTFNSDLKVNDMTVGKGASSSSTILGFDAGSLSTLGNKNVAVGYQALKANSGGTDNVALGYIAATALTTGTEYRNWFTSHEIYNFRSFKYCYWLWSIKRSYLSVGQCWDWC
jgi:hypothetical protein